MNIADLLKQYADSPTDTNADFDAVAREVPSSVLGDGIAEAMRSDKTPPFANLVGSLFGGSDPQQRAGLLTQLIRAAGPAVLASISGGALGKIIQGMQGKGEAGSVAVSPSDAAAVTPSELHEISAGAEKQDPGIFDKIGSYYAQHPEVVKVLGGAALAIALGRMAKRT
ncbi:MAG: hypothetical protein ABIV63_16225 [Caldimonas sp.]